MRSERWVGGDVREDDEAEEMNELKTIEASWATKASFVMMRYLTKASTASSLIDIELYKNTGSHDPRRYLHQCSRFCTSKLC